MNKYFITYFHKGDASFGAGNCVITSKKEIINFKDIREIEQKIKKDNNFEEVVIINYKKINIKREKNKCQQKK